MMVRIPRLLLLLCLVRCGTRAMPSDSAATDLHDQDAHVERELRQDALPPSLPWVSTFAGKDCKPYTGDGHRLDVEFFVTRYVRVVPTGDVYFTDDNRVFVVRGDQAPLPAATLVRETARHRRD
jgi:hypothetical protein